MELHTRSTEANGFDGPARLGRTGHKERTTWKAGYAKGPVEGNPAAPDKS